MPTFSQLPSGELRAQIRRRGLYRNGTFDTKREARDCATGIESPANHIAASGFALEDRGLETRGKERSREPTDDELERQYAFWKGNPWQRNDMVMICKFALATGMRQDEICRIQVKDVDRAQRVIVIRDRTDPQKKQGNDQLVPLLHDAWRNVQPLIANRTEGKIFEGVDEVAVSASFTRACQRLEILDLHFHGPTPPRERRALPPVPGNPAYCPADRA